MSTLSLDITFKRPGFMVGVQAELPTSGITAVLGSSGSGKTTLVRLIAGLEKPSSGRIAFNGEDWTGWPPQKRRVGLVFQDYALFEHMTVHDNIGFGLPKPDRDPRVRVWLERLGLTCLAERYPRSLSGGQRQRVALARALAPDPDLLLLDEPFSAVDGPRRALLREQLLDMRSLLDVPILLVTHDLHEVRALADHVLVMDKGKSIRSGPAVRVLNDPQDVAAARLLGWNNLLPINWTSGNRAGGSWGEVDLDHEAGPETQCLGIRPERIRISPDQGLEAQVRRISEMGAYRELHCRLKDGTPIVVHRAWDDPLPAQGSPIALHFPACSLLPLNRAVAPPQLLAKTGQ